MHVCMCIHIINIIHVCIYIYIYIMGFPRHLDSEMLSLWAPRTQGHTTC